MSHTYFCPRACEFKNSYGYCGISWCAKPLPNWAIGYVQTKPATNADRIRAMTDEELADWYCKRRECGTCTFDTASGCQLLDWLKSPVEVKE